MASISAAKLLSTPQVRWAVGGWAFFIIENAVLSENRTALIANLGKDNYYLLYGTFSTAATGSIGYSYFQLTRQAVDTSLKSRIPVPTLFISWTVLSMGLIMASQAVPMMQIPFMLKTVATESTDGETQKKLKLEVRCPFDFSEKNGNQSTVVHGVDRISRHAALWSLGLSCAGNALLLHQPHQLPLRIWWLGPSAIAWLGGMHSDSRYRRGMGGELDPMLESVTSNVPFVAMLTGKQGPLLSAFSDLFTTEIKLSNALIGVGIATLFVASRGRAKI